MIQYDIFLQDGSCETLVAPEDMAMLDVARIAFDHYDEIGIPMQSIMLWVDSTEIVKG